jgi:hypothetical protein
MKIFHAETDINAPPERVWRIISDLASYQEWNPFNTGAEGKLEVGGRLRMTYSTPGGEDWRRYAAKKENVRHTKVTRVIPGKEWSHEGGIPLLLTVTVTFRLERVAENKTKFIQHGTFVGPVTRFFSSEFFEGGRIGFEETGSALKQRAEQLSHP